MDDVRVDVRRGDADQPGDGEEVGHALVRAEGVDRLGDARAGDLAGDDVARRVEAGEHRRDVAEVAPR